MHLMIIPRPFRNWVQVAGIFMLGLLAFMPDLQAQISLSFTKVDPTCQNFTNGSVTVSATGGTAPYSYVWSTGATRNNLIGIGAGVYNVTVTDATNVTATGSIALQNPAPIVITETFSNICAGGSVTASATGGTAPYTYDWGNGLVGATQTLAPGGYTVLVTDANGCAATKFIIVPQPLTAQLRIGELRCFGDCDAAVDALPSGGTAPYTYRWNSGATTQSIVGIPSGTYSVTVTDANGCAAIQSGTVGNPPQIVITTTTVNPTCGGGSNGSAMASATGGRSPITFRWSNGQSGVMINNLAVGTYSVTATNANGCHQVSSVTLTTNANFTIDIVKIDASCGSNNGVATANITGGTAPFTYAWSTGATTQSINGLAVGNYTVTVTDAGGCANSASTLINGAGALSIDIRKKDASCGIADGTAKVVINSGTAPFSYIWSTGATTDSLSLLGAGTFMVTVTDANGCSAIASTTLTQTSAFTVNFDKRDVTCNGGSNGSIAAMILGGSAPYNYIWNNGITVGVIANLTAGNYGVTVTDANGCTATNNTTITEPSAIVPNVTTTATTCGLNNGRIAVQVTGGNAPYSYLWSNGSTIATLNNLAAGTYTLTITDANSCTKIVAATVDSSQALALTLSKSNVTCFGTATGSALVQANNGSGNYTYTWSNGTTTAALNNVAAGVYTVTVTDRTSGCSATQSVSISQPDAISLVISGRDAACGLNNGQTTAQVNAGGTAPFTYAWSNGATTATIGNLAGGRYTVTVTDANGCSATTAITINALTSPIVNISVFNPISCFNGTDGALTANVMNGTAPYSYVWSTGDSMEIIGSLRAGTYSLTVTDSVGCTGTASIVLTQPDSIRLQFQVTPASCLPTGNVTVVATGGTAPYGYVWSNAMITPSINNLAAGTYSVSVIDANGCVAYGATTVDAQTSPNLAVNVSIVQAISYQGNNDGILRAEAVNAANPVQYRWSIGRNTQVIDNLFTGTYTVTVTDGNNCTATKIFTLTEPTCQNVTDPGLIQGNQAFCAGEALTPIVEIAAPSGGAGPIEYMWMFSNETSRFDQNIWNAVPGATGKDLTVFPAITKKTYFIRCVRRGGCGLFVENINNIIVKEPLVATAILGNTTVCQGQSATFTAADNGAGTFYYWTFEGGAPNRGSGLSASTFWPTAGTYEVKLEAVKNGCTVTLRRSVTVTPCSNLSGNLVSFSATILNSKEVELKWVTTNEQQPSTYVLEASADGKAYEELTSRASLNRSNNLYRVVDSDAKLGKSYYRIKQMDNAGNMRLFTPQQVTIYPKESPVLSYPNPTSDLLFVEIFEKIDVEGTAELFDAQGKLVQVQSFDRNTTRITFDLSQSGAGIYFVKINRTDGITHMSKVTKL